MRYIYSLSENPFELSSFEGDKEIALSAGYKEITDEEYEKLVKHQLKWDNGLELYVAPQESEEQEIS